MDYTHPIRRRARGLRQIAAAATQPAIWTTLEPPLSGGSFKFHDYEAAMTPTNSRFLPFNERMPMAESLAHTAQAPRAAVEAACDGLEAAIGRLPDVLGDLPRFPGGIPQVVAGRTGQERR